MRFIQNIGIINALIRITCGLTILTWSTARLSKHPWRESYLIVAFLGAMKVAEGILRYCPITDFYEQATNNQNHNYQNERKDITPVPSQNR
ncbi:MAG TPA: DUF2892 domain-containing protein [Chondromyces sp.]|nr:DUF2892 domain-containing protein [Chondromyces sp.]